MAKADLGIGTGGTYAEPAVHPRRQFEIVRRADRISDQTWTSSDMQRPQIMKCKGAHFIRSLHVFCRSKKPADRLARVRWNSKTSLIKRTYPAGSDRIPGLCNR